MNTDNSANRRNWHIEKSVSIGHILTTLVIAFSAFTWASNIDKRVSANELADEYISQSLDETNSRVNLLRSEIRQDLRDINIKLDRIIESQVNQ